MTMARTQVNVAVEGLIDEAVTRRLIEHVGGEVGRVYPRGGKSHLTDRLRAYNQAANHAAWLILIDLDTSECAPALRGALMPDAASLMCFRIAVREVEAWLLADREELAAFLKVPWDKIPEHPEDVDDPKQLIVNLARKSRSKRIREAIVPTPESLRETGPAYDSTLMGFVANKWSPDRAALASESLSRCLNCLGRLTSGRTE